MHCTMNRLGKVDFTYIECFSLSCQRRGFCSWWPPAGLHFASTAFAPYLSPWRRLAASCCETVRNISRTLRYCSSIAQQSCTNSSLSVTSPPQRTFVLLPLYAAEFITNDLLLPHYWLHRSESLYPNPIFVQTPLSLYTIEPETAAFDWQLIRADTIFEACLRAHNRQWLIV